MFLSKKKISMKHQGWNINENNVNKLAVVSHFPDIIKGLLVADRCSYSELCLSCSSHYITNENKTMMATPKRAKKKKKLNHDRGNLHASRVNTPSPIFTWSLWVQAVQSWGKTTKKTHRHIYTHTHSLHSDTLCCCCCYCLLSLSLSLFVCCISELWLGTFALTHSAFLACYLCVNGRVNEITIQIHSQRLQNVIKSSFML